MGGEETAKLDQRVQTLWGREVVGKGGSGRDRKGEAGRETYIVVEIAHQLEVSVGSLAVDDPVPLLGHEQTQRQTQISLQQSFSQSVRRLLCVADLREIRSLQWEASRRESDSSTVLLHSVCSHTSAFSSSPPAKASS